MPHPASAHTNRTRARLGRRKALALGLGVGLAATLAPLAQASEPTSARTTTPTPTTTTAAQRSHAAWVTATMKRMSLEEKVGQLFVQNVYGSDPHTPDQRNVPLYGVATPAEVVKKYRLGGVIYFAWTDSVKNPKQIATLSNGLQRASLNSTKARIPLAISTDQEMGVVTRVGPPATQFPGNMALGAGRSTTDARTAAAITGKELRAVGINTNFAPVADVNVNPLNPVIGTRSFSSSPGLTSDLVAAQVAGYQQDAAVSSSAKHFPGHGDTAVDSHVDFPIITHSREEWERLDAPPFKAAIGQGIDMIMTAHLAFPALDDSGLPATLSKPIMTDVLRDELGYDGVIITDSLAMEGVRKLYDDAEVAVRALEAGVDQLLMTPAMDQAYAAVIAAVKSGRLSQETLDAKVARVLTQKAKRGMVGDAIVDADGTANTVGTPQHMAAADAITERTPTLVVNDDKTLPMAAAGKKVLVTGFGPDTTATLSDELAARGATTTLNTTGAAPTDAQIAAAVKDAAGKDAVVVTTMKAWDTKVTDKNAGQQKLVKALQDTGIPVVVIATRDPYDIAHLPGTRTYVATYSFNAVSMRAAAKVLTGEVNPTGTLPVDVPAKDDPATVLYPFGHGLNY